MKPDQILVTFQTEGPLITAHVSGPVVQESPADAPYGHLTTPLRERGLVCSVEFGLSDCILHAELPDGSAFIVSPPQEPAADHRPGYPDRWLVTRVPPDGATFYEVVYDSEPDGPHAHHGGSVPALMAALDARLDQLGVPTRAEFQRSARSDTVDGILHRAGFISVARSGDHFHRLPAGMTDPVEQRRAVTRAVDMLKTESFVYGCPADLIDPDMPIRTDRRASPGDRLGELTASIRAAGHTREVVAAISELTAPGDGVLYRVLEALEATSSWWEGLGTPAGPVYADRLRRIAQQVAVSALEIRNLRNELADRYTPHPQQTRYDSRQQRASAARAVSPAARHATSTPPSPGPTAPAKTPSLRTSTRPHH